jgi:hypothetical protein
LKGLRKKRLVEKEDKQQEGDSRHWTKSAPRFPATPVAGNKRILERIKEADSLAVSRDVEKAIFDE